MFARRPIPRVARQQARALGWTVLEHGLPGFRLVELARDLGARRAVATSIHWPQGAEAPRGWVLDLAPLAPDGSLAGLPDVSLRVRRADWQTFAPPPAARNASERALPATGDAAFDGELMILRDLEPTPDLESERRRDEIGVALGRSPEVRRLLRDLWRVERAELRIHSTYVELAVTRFVPVYELPSPFGRLADVADAAVAALRPAPPYR